MLRHLHIQNYALITHLDIDFNAGFSVLTGETGAGKSILLDSLGLVLGKRAETSLIRKGADKLSVTAVFDNIPDKELLDLLQENDIEVENNELMIKRSLNISGVGKIFVNDQIVSAKLLKEIGKYLVEIHGQFDNQSLLNPATHINILDSFARDEDVKEECRIAYQNWQKKKKELKEIEESFAKAKEDEEYLKHNLSELETLNPQKGEEEELNKKRHILMNSEKIITSIKDAFEYLSKYGDEPEKFIANANYALERIPDDAKNENINSIVSELENATSNLSDAYEKLKQILSENDGDTSTLETTEERLFTIRELARKHKVTPDELPEFMLNLKKIVDNINNSDEVLNEKRKEELDAKQSYLDVANKLSDIRSEYGKMLSARVMTELPPLKLEKATFETIITTTKSYTQEAKVKAENIFGEECLLTFDFRLLTEITRHQHTECKRKHHSQ